MVTNKFSFNLYFNNSKECYFGIEQYSKHSWPNINPKIFEKTVMANLNKWIEYLYP